jgi:hypothetical protein
MHLLFDCERYSEPLWHELGSTINIAREMQNPGCNRVQLHAYNDMYNLETVSVSLQNNKEIQLLIQEIKRSMIYRRYKRCTPQVIIRYNRIRVIGHILIVLTTIIYLQNIKDITRPFYLLEQSFKKSNLKKITTSPIARN